MNVFVYVCLWHEGCLVCCCKQGVLSKLSAAKELMGEIMEREKRKQAEREAAKAAAGAEASKEEAPTNVTA